MAVETTLINSALRLAYDATGLVPGLGQFKAVMEIAVDVAPAVEAAVEYFTSKEGEVAVGHLRAIFEALPKNTGGAVFTTPPEYPGYRWDIFEGWVKNTGA
jgi:hypothetical protein